MQDPRRIVTARRCSARAPRSLSISTWPSSQQRVSAAQREGAKRTSTASVDDLDWATARRLTHHVDGCGEYIPRSPLSMYQVLPRAVLFELFAQTPYLGVDRAVVNLVVVQV